MAKKHVFEGVDEEEVLECYLDCEMTPAEIVKELGISAQAVRRICARYNMQTASERQRWLSKYGWNWGFAK